MLGHNDVDELVGDISGWMSKMDKDDMKSQYNASYERYRKQQQDPNGWIQMNYKYDYVRKQLNIENELRNMESDDAKLRRDNILDYNKWKRRVKGRVNGIKKSGIHDYRDINDINNELNNIKMEDYYRHNIYQNRSEYESKRNEVYNEHFKGRNNDNNMDNDIDNEYILKAKAGPTFSNDDRSYKFVYEKIDKDKAKDGSNDGGYGVNGDWNDQIKGSEMPIKEIKGTVNLRRPSNANLFNPGDKIFDDIKGWDTNPQKIKNKLNYLKYMEKMKQDKERY